MNRIFRIISNRFIPLLFAFVFVFSLFKLYLFSKETDHKDIKENTKYIDGFAYKENWNNAYQCTFLSSENEKYILSFWDEEVGDILLREKYVKIDLEEADLKLPNRARNPGEFDQTEYLASKEIYKIIEVNEESIRKCENELNALFLIKTKFLSIMSKVRESMQLSLENTMGEEYSAVAIGILTGDTSNISKNDMNNYRDAGISHIMAVSGMHIGFIQSISSKLFSRKSLGNSKRNILCIISLFLYAGIAGFSPSVMRAMLQTSYMLVAKILKRPADKTNSLCISCTLQLIDNPYILYSSGFVLSYCAAASINFIKPVLCKRIFFFGRLPDWLGTGISVNIGMLPIMIYYFNSFSPIGIIATFFAGKLACGICICGLLTWLLYLLPFCQILTLIPASLNVFITEVMNKISHVGSGLPAPFGAMVVPQMDNFVMASYYLILIFIFSKVFRRVIKNRKIIMCIVALSFTFIYFSHTGDTQILFFDVGQGLSVMVKTDGLCGLVDTGEGDVDVGNLLLKQGVGKLDFILITHGHSDHTGGIENVLETHNVGCIFVPDNKFDEGIAKVCSIANEKGVRVIKISGEYYAKINNTNFFFYTNDNYKDSSNSSDVNNTSVILHVENENGGVLFTGDIEEETESAFCEKYGSIRCDILQVAHHGSDSGTLYKNVSKIAPKYAIISVGLNNSYGHPSNGVIDTLRKVNSCIKRTDECGAVKLTMRKGKITTWQKLKIQE